MNSEHNSKSPEVMDLNPTDIHIFSFPLHCDKTQEQRLESFLSEDECRRAENFVFEKDRRKFIVARGRMRQILADYLNLSPEKILFDYGEHGKPALKDEAAGLKFNLSHAHELAALAISTCEIGVDVEWCRSMDNMKSVAAKVYTDIELSLLFDTSPTKRTELFYKFWTCKEAFIKLTGEGFSRDPQTIQLPTGDIYSTDWIPAMCEEIREDVMLKAFKVAPGYKGAIAVAQCGVKVHTFDFGENK